MSVLWFDTEQSRAALALRYAENRSAAETSPSVAKLIARKVSVLVGWLPFKTRCKVLTEMPARSQNSGCVIDLRFSQGISGEDMNAFLSWGDNCSQPLKLSWDDETPEFLFAYNASMANHHIRAWRKKRGLTLQELCDGMEAEPGVPLISYSQLSKIERGEQPYSQPILEAIAARLNVRASQLLEDDPDIQGEVVDFQAILNQLDPDKRDTIVTMIKAVINE